MGKFEKSSGTLLKSWPYFCELGIKHNSFILSNDSFKKDASLNQDCRKKEDKIYWSCYFYSTHSAEAFWANNQMESFF